MGARCALKLRKRTVNITEYEARRWLQVIVNMRLLQCQRPDELSRRSVQLTDP